MWISGGDQEVSDNIVHLVLAKVPGTDGVLVDGTAGISLFVVPKVLPDGSRNDITVAGLNHKMGYRGTVNCLLNFGERKGAIGWRVGEVGQGLRQMFRMMNEARIGVGLGAAAVGYRGYRCALHYARERHQGRLHEEHPRGRPSPSLSMLNVKRMLLQQEAYVEGALALCLYCARLVDEHDDPHAANLLGLLTPVAENLVVRIRARRQRSRNPSPRRVRLYTRFRRRAALARQSPEPDSRGHRRGQAIDLLGRKILRSDGTALAVAMAQ